MIYRTAYSTNWLISTENMDHRDHSPQHDHFVEIIWADYPCLKIKRGGDTHALKNRCIIILWTKREGEERKQNSFIPKLQIS